MALGPGLKRYDGILVPHAPEVDSSSGLIVTSGTGSTGWALSIRRQRRTQITLPKPADDRLAQGECLEIISEMNDGGVLFGDGIEDDRLEFRWGLRARIRQSKIKLKLVLAQ